MLYLSKYIIRNKSAYYRLLQDVWTQGNWEEWILFILDGIEQTAKETLLLVKGSIMSWERQLKILKLH